MFPLYHCYYRERIKNFCHCDADKFRLKRIANFEFLKVSKKEDFTKIQQEIQKKTGNRYNRYQCFIVASKGNISVINS